MEGGTAMESVITALTTAFSTMATDALSGITGILPVVLPVFSAIVIVGLALRLVHRIVK